MLKVVDGTTVVSLQGGLFAPQQQQLCFDFSVMSIQVLKETDSLSERWGKRRELRGLRGKTQGTKTYQNPENPVYPIIIQHINELMSRCSCFYLDTTPVRRNTFMFLHQT